MKKALVIILLLIIGLAGFVWFKFKTDKKVDFNGDKAVEIRADKHSAAFNASIDSMMAAYFSMKSAFVEADTVGIKAGAAKMIVLADSIHIDEIKKDTTGIYETVVTFLNDVKSNTQSLLTQTKLEEMRLDFKQVNEQLYSFLKSVNYEGKKLYWQVCPMAFNDTESANWVSDSKDIINPYLGKKHPKYHAEMLECGEVVDSIQAK
ncbi:MAG: DUF3347 domain-containing protein [Bacteroidota bacterium]